MTGQSQTLILDSLPLTASRDSVARALQLRFKSAQPNTPSPGYTQTKHGRSGVSSTSPGRRSMRQHHPWSVQLVSRRCSRYVPCRTATPGPSSGNSAHRIEVHVNLPSARSGPQLTRRPTWRDRRTVGGLLKHLQAYACSFSCRELSLRGIAVDFNAMSASWR